VGEFFGQDGSGIGVFGQRYTSSGTPAGTEFQVNTYTTNFQGFQAVAAAAAGNFVVVWESALDQDGSGAGVFGQRMQLCGATPRFDCDIPLEPQKGLFLLKRNAGDPTKNKLRWKWIKGEDILPLQLEDPRVANHYALCVYVNGTLTMNLVVPADGTCDGKPCWKAVGSGDTAGFAYKNKAASGVTRIDMRAGIGGDARFDVQGKGLGLGVPTLPLTQPVKVQLVNANGYCWEATYSSPAIQNDSSTFKDKDD
jgi:hypothetical protein